MVKQFRSMTYPYVAWISVIIVVPMLLIVLYAFTTSGNDVLTIQFTFDNFVRFVTDSVFMEVLLRSLYIAVITTLICILLGYPIAYVIAQLPDRGNTLAILLITMPTWVNMLMRGWEFCRTRASSIRSSAFSASVPFPCSTRALPSFSAWYITSCRL